MQRTTEVSYSPMEQELLELLLNNKGKQVATTDLLKVYYKKIKKEEPEKAQQTVLGALRSLQRRVSQNNESFVIKNTERRGPHPMIFWAENRKSGK